jgi:hypothetical protein
MTTMRVATTLPTAVAALAMLAACSEQPAAPAPAPAALSAAPSAARAPLVSRSASTWALLRVANVRDGVIAETTVEFRVDGDPIDTFKKLVADNGADDADGRPGYFKVKMPYTGFKYVAQIKQWPAQYVPFGGYASGGHAGQTSDLGTMTLQFAPVVTLHMKSTFGPYVGGAVIKVTDGTSATEYSDNGANDLDASPGVITFRLFNNAAWTACEITAPSGLALADPSCVLVQAPFNAAAEFTMLHAPLVL